MNPKLSGTAMGQCTFMFLSVAAASGGEIDSAFGEAKYLTPAGQPAAVQNAMRFVEQEFFLPTSTK